VQAIQWLAGWRADPLRRPPATASPRSRRTVSPDMVVASARTHLCLTRELRAAFLFSLQHPDASLTDRGCD